MDGACFACIAWNSVFGLPCFEVSGIVSFVNIFAIMVIVLSNSNIGIMPKSVCVIRQWKFWIP